MAKINIGWAHLSYDTTRGLDLFVEKPQSVYDTYMKDTNYKYKQCPATTDVARNTFIIRSPFDVHFIVDADKRTLEFIEPYVQPFEFYNMREGQYSETDQPLLSINFHQIFLTEHKDVELTITAPWFERASQDFKVVPGRFKISDWWRPIDFALQLPERRSTVRIKKHDPLFYATISTGVSADIAIIREINITAELENMMARVTQAKHYQPRCPLKTLYGAFNRFRRKPKLEFID